MKTISPKSQIVKFGIYTLFFTISFQLMQFFLGTHYENDNTSNIVGLLILALGILVCALDYKKINEISTSFHSWNDV